MSVDEQVAIEEESDDSASSIPPRPSASPSRSIRTMSPWTIARWTLLAAYGVGYVYWFFTRGIIINRLLVLLSVGIFLVVASVGRPIRQWVRMLGDFTLFVLMWLAYDESRGIADSLGAPIQVESVRNIDRFLFFGEDPTVWLQYRFYRGPANVQWYDIVGSMAYYSHFIVPPITIAVLWFVNRHQWVRYMRRFATVLFVACIMFVVLPTAPPWMASGGKNSLGLELDALPPLRQPAGNGWREIGLDAAVRAWRTGRDWSNQVAAMPSLHNAYALFIVLFFWKKVSNRTLRWSMLLYPAIMSVALMYFAEHYFIDALAGWAVVGVAFWIWNRIEGKLAERKLDGSLPASGDDPPASESDAATDGVLQPS